MNGDIMETILELNDIESPPPKVPTTDVEIMREILKEKEAIFYQVKEHLNKN